MSVVSCVCVCVCVCACECVCICFCVCVCACVYLFLSVCLSVHLHAFCICEQVYGKYTISSNSIKLRHANKTYTLTLKACKVMALYTGNL